MSAGFDEALATVRAADAALAEAGPVPLSLGARLAQVVGAVAALDDDDWWLPGLRDRAGAVLRGVPVERLHDGLVGARPWRVVPPGGSPALRALVAVGIARGGDGAAVVHLGPGSVSDGAFAEALDLAARHTAPVVFVIDQPDLSGAPIAEPSHLDPAGLAQAAGIPCVRVESDDVGAIHAAVAAAKATGRPAVVLAEAPVPR